MTSPTPPERETVATADLIADARALIDPARRTILGITGAPASGKSTLAGAIVAALAPDAALIGLDGFHLANLELDRLGRRERKGAVDTFDGAGFRDLLRRVRARQDEVVYAAAFDRSIEESIACAVPVARSVPLVVVEGNYLLADEEPWREASSLLDRCWYLEPDDGVRVDRLIDRHVRFGRDRRAATDRALGTDQRNADLIAATRGRADRLVRIEESGDGDAPAVVTRP